MEDLTTGAARVREYLRDGRLLRGEWAGTDAEGRERACLLAALVPACGVARSAAACPADTLWPWLAHLTVWIDDAPSEAAWPGYVERYAAVLPRLASLPESASRTCEYAVRALILRDACGHTQDARAVAVCEAVIALCDRVVAGDEPRADEWSMVRSAARAAEASAAKRAERAVALALAETLWAASAAAASAASAAWSVTQEWATSEEAAWAASDRIVDGILRVLESATKGGAL